MAFIWLPKSTYPGLQEAHFNTNRPADPARHHYAAAEFTHTCRFSRAPERVRLHVGGAAQFFLYVNGDLIGIGPASAGGDFLAEGSLGWEFSNPYEIPGGRTEYEFRALVRLQPEVLTEYTQGVGMFSLSGEADFGDRAERFETDETWLCRAARKYVSPDTYDASAAEDPFVPAERISYPVPLTPAGVPMLTLDTLLPPQGGDFALPGGTELTLRLDRVWAAYPMFTASAPVHLIWQVGEDDRTLCGPQTAVLAQGHEYMPLRMHSAGCLRVRAEDAAPNTRLRVRLLCPHYPFGQRGKFRTSDQGLDRVMDVCRHTLGICRQTIHLDSPKHQELLACTGDYYIEMLMTLFENGDLRLAGADIRRTARWLCENDGRMFHTTYSLIWVQMLRRYYLYTADADTVRFCADALRKLLARFEGYADNEGIIGNAPDYMFVDWMVLEGYSMHHPPKALGQTVLNAFWYKALLDAAELADMTGLDRGALLAKAEAFRAAFRKRFYDAERGLYTDGTDAPERSPLYRYLPDNPRGLRHFSRYPQALAALYGLCPENDAARLAEAAADETNGLPLVQPYFMHFVLEAVLRNGLADRFAMPLLRKWIPIVEACPQGLQEGWIKPEETYRFDHSHAWGGTPAYHLPLLLTGLEVLEPGFAAISLRPRLFGLRHAYITFPTPRGSVSVHMEEGREPEIDVPEGIRCTVRL